MVLLFHNILWSRYKGAVFTEVNRLQEQYGLDFDIVQIAETEGNRVGLSTIDLDYHKYRYELLFTGAYERIPRFALWWALLRRVWKSRASLILLPGYHLPEYWLMFFIAKIKCQKVGFFCDSTMFDKPDIMWKALLKRIIFSMADVIFGYGVRSRDYALKNGAKLDRIFYRCQASAMPPGYSPSVVLNNRLACRSSEPVFLYVGRFSQEKNLFLLFDAFKRYLEEMKTGRLILVGAGILEADLIKYAFDISISENVDFAGSKNSDELSQFYTMASCLVLPSLSEPWGLVVNEALAYGCPVVVSNLCGCVPELVIDDETGYSFDPSSIEDLHHCLNKIVINFKDTENTVSRCLALISKYTPVSAATQIIQGSISVIGGLR